VHYIPQILAGTGREMREDAGTSASSACTFSHSHDELTERYGLLLEMRPPSPTAKEDECLLLTNYIKKGICFWPKAFVDSELGAFHSRQCAKREPRPDANTHRK
jgi:hypothetical protein